MSFRLLCLLLASSAVPCAAGAQSASGPAQLPALKQLSIEELLEVDVTLPLRREAPVRDAPVAISVVTAEDIHRSGATSLPEALRQVPGLFAARSTGAAWVMTTRGFASSTANKLLVMVDGRSVYSPLFSGVFWDQQDAVLDDLSRIEVIRGPGASLWGSNAVNGVINVVSKPAAETQGTLLTVSSGLEEHLHAAARYGGRLGAGHYRVFGKYRARDDAKLADGSDARDDQRFGMGGFRYDLTRGTTAFTLQGDMHATRVGVFDQAADIEGSGINLLTRWQRRWGNASDLQVLAYVDRTTRDVPAQFRESRVTADIEVQHRTVVARRHTLAWGGGYRRSADDTTPTPLLFFVPEDRSTNLLGAFVHDDIAWTSRLSTIVGLKIEHNDYTGVEYQPTGRVRWTAAPGHVLWGAVSRAVRLPTRLDTDLRLLGGGRVTLRGSPDFASESLVASELGYRAAVGRALAWEAVYFHHAYDNLRSQEPGDPVVLGNGLNVASDGVVLTATVQPRPFARLTGSYAYLTSDLSFDADSRDLARGRSEVNDPRHQVQGQLRLDLPRRVAVDVMARRVSALANTATPGYSEASFRVGWRLTPALELALVGRDVLNPSHFEFIAPTAVRQVRVERTVYTRATFVF